MIDESLKNYIEFNILPLYDDFGSTAITGIMAKPIVDILVEIPTDCDWNVVK